MRISPALLAAVFSLACLAAPVRADEPKPVRPTPAVQALLAELLKALQTTMSEAAVNVEPAEEAPAAPAVSREAKRSALGSASSLRTGSLRAGSLSAGGLGGSGSRGGLPRLSSDEWRLLFPLRQDGR